MAKRLLPPAPIFRLRRARGEQNKPGYIWVGVSAVGQHGRDHRPHVGRGIRTSIGIGTADVETSLRSCTPGIAARLHIYTAFPIVVI
jgi:hypothetical protein